MFFRIKVVLQQMGHLNFTYIYRHTTLKSSTFDQPRLEIILVLCSDKRKNNKGNKGGTRQKCKLGGQSVLGSQTKNTDVSN